jgi:predicted nucleotide-binding protein
MLGRHYQRVLSRVRQQAYQVFVITSDEELMKTVNALLQGEYSTTIIWYSNLNQQQLLTG